MIWLRKSTVRTIKFGPFLDKDDGVTLETGLATALDNATTGVRVSKNGGNYADRNSSTAPTYDETGEYNLELDGTDTNTLGVLKIIFEESATTLPVWQHFMVISQNWWDSLFASATLSVNMVQLGGATQSATDLKDFADAGYDPAINKVNGVKLVDVVTTTSALTGHTAQTGDSFARLGNPDGASVSADIASIKSDVVRTSGSSDSGSTTTMVDSARFEADTDYWKGSWIRFTNGSISGQCRLITGFNPGSNTITFAPATTQAVSVQDYEIVPAADIGLATIVTTLTGHTAQTGDSFARLGAAGSGLTDLGGMSTSMLAEVESEVNDALDTAIAELGVAAPAATPTLRTGLMLMYMALRNKLVVQTSGTDAIEVYNNAGTKIAAKLITDAGGDYTEEEMA